MTQIILANVLVVFNHFLDFYFNMKYKEKSKILLSNIATSTISLLSFVLLNSVAGIVSCAVTILRVIVIYYKDKKGKRWIPLFILFAILYLSPLLDFETPLVILLCISNYILYIPKWFSKDMQFIRATSCLACILLVPYLIYIQNYSGAIFTIIDIVTYFSSYMKWKVKDKKEQALE